MSGLPWSASTPASSSSAASAAAAARAAITRAIIASGTIVKVDPDEFERLLHQQSGLLVVASTGGFFSTTYRYLTSYKGLAFFTTSARQLRIPEDHELIVAKKIWVPE
jgi:hypothetical protein